MSGVFNSRTIDFQMSLNEIRNEFGILVFVMFFSAKFSLNRDMSALGCVGNRSTREKTPPYSKSQASPACLVPDLSLNSSKIQINGILNYEKTNSITLWLFHERIRLI